MIELVKNKDTWYIRNGMRRTNCVCDRITRKQLATLHRKIGKVLGIKDWQKIMEEDRDKFLQGFAYRKKETKNQSKTGD